MRYYLHKIQWLMPIRSGWYGTEAQNINDTIKLIKVLGVKSLDCINFLDKDLKKLDSYSNMTMYGHDEATRKIVRYIRKTLKENPEINSIEILKN